MQLCAKVNAKMVKTLSCSLAFAFAMAIAATLHGTADSYSFRGHYTTPTADSDASCSVNNRQDCYPWAYQDGGVSPKECGAHGCCYDSTNSGEPWCFYPSVPAPSKQQCSLNNANRVDCFPDGDASEGECNARGCCWVPVQDSDNLPWCFYPRVVSIVYHRSRFGQLFSKDVSMVCRMVTLWKIPETLTMVSLPISHGLENKEVPSEMIPRKFAWMYGKTATRDFTSSLLSRGKSALKYPELSILSDHHLSPITPNTSTS